MIPERAAQQAVRLLDGRLNGQRSRRGKILGIAALVARRIAATWAVGPSDWKLKHVLWYLSRELQHASGATRTDHWHIVRVLIEALGRSNWLGHLDHGPWVRRSGEKGRTSGDSGGRPRRRTVTPPDG